MVVKATSKGPYFVTDSEKIPVEHENGKLIFSSNFLFSCLLVDKKITNARDMINVLDDATRGGYLILTIAEDIEREALATFVLNKLRGPCRIAALKVPGFGDWTDLKIDRAAEHEYEGKVNKRIAKLSGGVAVIKVGVQTVIELKERKLRVEDALSAAKVEADIVERALGYQLKLIAKDAAGVDGSVVTDRVLSNYSPKYGYNAALESMRI
ncbi:ruBisCO large subunit-binding protein subunit beta, chloroplastic-like [Asparagus officinalis]|uniref:ruBisCO large subunit-binding protein subunit beta, chloroplastic-like n=1 Tax=Asparagus officinalis TaxID=4686 RepID=UPI00098DFD1F|nr:ruBisCO large subunit-binding protein subunit beta, chloroplastic-like [Asparagus officinalis]